MMKLVGSLVLAVAVVGIAGIGPVAAAESGHGYGASTRCRYVAVAEGKYGWTEALLNRIAVTPPKVFASHSGTQKVGWRFIVRRSKDRAAGPWKVTYRSPIQKAKASPNKAASFDTLRVGVAVPQVDEQARIYYRVTLKIFWYRPNGTVQSKVSYRMPVYSTYVAGEIDPYFEECPGLLRAFFN